jgi:hypothetical protein
MSFALKNHEHFIAELGRITTNPMAQSSSRMGTLGRYDRGIRLLLSVVHGLHLDVWRADFLFPA